MFNWRPNFKFKIYNRFTKNYSEELIPLESDASIAIVMVLETVELAIGYVIVTLGRVVSNPPLLLTITVI